MKTELGEGPSAGFGKCSCRTRRVSHDCYRPVVRQDERSRVLCSLRRLVGCRQAYTMLLSNWSGGNSKRRVVPDFSLRHSRGRTRDRAWKSNRARNATRESQLSQRAFRIRMRWFDCHCVVIHFFYWIFICRYSAGLVHRRDPSWHTEHPTWDQQDSFVKNATMFLRKVPNPYFAVACLNSVQLTYSRTVVQAYSPLSKIISSRWTVPFFFNWNNWFFQTNVKHPRVE